MDIPQATSPGVSPPSLLDGEQTGSSTAGPAVSPFALIPATSTSTPTNPFGPPEPQAGSNDTSRPAAAIRRRNHARLNDIISRLENFDGSVTELLAIASVQQQLDTAFRELDRAKNQLKDVLRQFELQGHISNRQCQKKNVAVKDLTKSSQCIAQLTKKLWDLQRRDSSA
ncbi:hypothetical protein ONZ43_g5195 [Nemania bipapillata]|uniref:Uncharacterized protein n=1 Tax=Nemania bipapillata TaxID=110536 RepID=A0ACC2IDR0_9PEZI|nr:hypothetical protein ONZ43_g5195 [Nemania bipapillata]